MSMVLWFGVFEIFKITYQLSGITEIETICHFIRSTANDSKFLSLSFIIDLNNQ